MKIPVSWITKGATLCCACACVLAAPSPVQPTLANGESAQLNALGDELLAHMEATDVQVRVSRKLAVTNLDDFTPTRAARETAFSVAALKKLNRIPLTHLSHNDWIFDRLLQHTFEKGVHAQEDYWFDFDVTPYHIWGVLNWEGRALAAQDLSTAAGRDNYLHLLDEVGRTLREIAAKTQEQAKRGIRVPQPAIGGIRKTFEKFRDTATDMFVAASTRLAGASTAEQREFDKAQAQTIATSIRPAYDEVLQVFDEGYVARAPSAVGLGQYPGGMESYLRRIVYETGLQLTPQQIHDQGLAEVNVLENRLKAAREQLGFKGDRASFDQQLRTDPKFYAKSPQELEARYLSAIARIEPHIPDFFSLRPEAPYAVKRLDAASESGMTFGTYVYPTLQDPHGYYLYNGSNLDKRPLFQVPHLIFHELIPGHHFQIALTRENKSLHPVCWLLRQPAFTEGWAEYAAQLAAEMGGYPDPYELYGHLLSQLFLTSRLVVDTGMNALGWPLEKARQYMREHDFDSDALIATETLRYSTDVPAQALNYRLGYDEFWTERKKAETALGKSFDIREFHAAAIGYGSMPLDVLQEHLDWFIAQKQQQGKP